MDGFLGPGFAEELALERAGKTAVTRGQVGRNRAELSRPGYVVKIRVVKLLTNSKGAHPDRMGAL